MTRILMPTKDELLKLAQVRDDVCVSIYLETTPLKLGAEACRIELGNLTSEAFRKLKENGFNKRRLASLQDHFEYLTGAEDFCQHQSHSLAILATPDSIRMYRLANKLQTQLEMSDRFYIKPLLRAFTFPQQAYILALSENMAKVIELFPDAEPEELHVENLPASATEAVGRSKLTSSGKNPLHSDGSIIKKQRLAQYCRSVDEAIRKLQGFSEIPVILVATEPLLSMFRSITSAKLTPEIVHTSPDKLPDHELVRMARPVLDAYYAEEIEETKRLYSQAQDQGKVETDLTVISRAATFGMVSLAMVDFDFTTTGTINENGTLKLFEGPGSYGVIDEIVKRILETGGRVVAVRKQDMIGQTGVAVILRYTPDNLEITADQARVNA